MLMVAAVLAPLPAAAAVRGPSTLPSFHIRVKLVRVLPRRTASCSARTHTSARVAKVAKKVLPVACEQPPRSWLGLSLKSAAAATILGG